MQACAAETETATCTGNGLPMVLSMTPPPLHPATFTKSPVIFLFRLSCFPPCSVRGNAGTVTAALQGWNHANSFKLMFDFYHYIRVDVCVCRGGCLCGVAGNLSAHWSQREVFCRRSRTAIARKSKQMCSTSPHTRPNILESVSGQLLLCAAARVYGERNASHSASPPCCCSCAYFSAC